MATPDPELSTPRSHQDDTAAPSDASNFRHDDYLESLAADGEQAPLMTGDSKITEKKTLFSFIRTKDFWIVLVLGQALSILNVSDSTFSTLLAREGTSIPAFQTFFFYAVLNIIFTSVTISKYGFKRWLHIVRHDGWKYFLFAFCDVQGNYFVILAFRYTTILSAQLINFWAIVVVVAISYFFLHVRYHYMQILGILVCIGGMGVLMGSDHITGSNGGQATDAVLGDLFALLSATFYGFSNVVEEYFVTKRPVYEVIGQLGFWATFINGIQACIFDRSSFASASWNGHVATYLFGYTVCLVLFYATVPLVYRLASAAFMNISMLTSNFWGVIIGLHVLHLQIHWMYPIAFLLIILGHFVYYLGQAGLEEARKPWLGRDQEGGVSGLFTARRRLEQANAAQHDGEEDASLLGRQHS